MSWKPPAPSTGVTSVSTQSNGPSATPASAAASPDASLICRWNACSLKLVTPEALYEHLSESHVGRKSTNNLNLTCQWNSCHTTTIKRDHMTSHIRVHVPLRPHKCHFCGKSFKRPQDLKKHVKTHADDSALSPEDQAGLHGAYLGSNGEGTASDYDRNDRLRTDLPGFLHQAPGHAKYYGQGAHAPTPSLGLYYSPPRGPDYLEHLADGFDTRKRADNVVDNYFGSATPRALYTFSYVSVGRPLLPVHGGLALQTSGPFPAPVDMAQHQHAPVAAGGHGNPCSCRHLAQQYYLPPMPNPRSKNNPVQLDQILEQMQRTVFENVKQSNHTIHVHVHVQNPFEFHHCPSPPAAASRGRFGAIPLTQDGYAAVSAAHMASPLAATSSTGTSAPPPLSSNLTYTSGQSPSPSSSRMSPNHVTTPLPPSSTPTS